MRPADVGAASDALLHDDWGDRRQWFEFAAGFTACHAIVAELDDRIVGTGVGTGNGRVGWIGTIWVASDQRRRGLGRALTEAVISALHDAGVRTLVLVASEAGGPLYESMGFVVQSWYEIWEADGLPDTPEPESATGATSAKLVRAFGPVDLPPIAALDAEATGEDRFAILEAFASPISSRVAVADDGRITGFVVRAPWGGGATIAEDADTAMTILAARRRAAGPDGRVRVGILGENEIGNARFEAAGLRRIWSAPRMVRGEPLRWRPDRIWGQFNHAIG